MLPVNTVSVRPSPHTISLNDSNVPKPDVAGREGSTTLNFNEVAFNVVPCGT